jgi:M6 family metalloprotease-like protein
VRVALARQRERVSELAAPGTPGFTAIENLVVFIRFADEPEFTSERPLAAYEALFNADGDGAVSMRSYFAAASYGQLAVQTSFFPASGGPFVTSYRATRPRAHYMPFEATVNPDGYGDEGEREMREKDLLVDAVAAIAAQVPASLVIDGNGDGDVDNVCFIVSGTPTAWNTLLWPHQWSLAGRSATINSKRVASFNLQLESMVQVGVLCHEMTHTLGAPDLYHYTSDNQTPVGRWDLMASTTTPPQQINAYTKYRYLGWIKELPAITTSGTYELAPLSAGPNCFKVASPNAPREYFLLEYRTQTGIFDGTVPGSGLVAYRINSGVQGNAAGPPDGVYVFRPGGAPGANGAIRDAALGRHTGRSAIDGTTDPFAFLTWGDLGGLAIAEIGEPGDTVTFTVSIQPACALGAFAPIGPESPSPGGAIELQWSAASGATSYDLHVGTGPEPPLLATTAATSVTVDVAPGSAVRWRVIAANACGRFASGPAWRLDVDPVVPVLARGAAIPGVEIAAAGDWQFYRVEVPPGARALTLTTAGGAGDADLYLRRGAFPTASRNECASVRAGNVERCVVTAPAPGTWFIGMAAYSAFSGVTLGADWTLPPRRRLPR